ncbi:MAG: ABC transporter ATP-binding protein [Bdellovibrionota bacterium]
MIEIIDLKKQFKVYRNRSGMLKDAFGLAKENIDYEIVESLNGINLKVKKGSVHGILGMNGAGKSTLLKILTGVLNPSSGDYLLKGRVAALLELGTGFHGELTGRENIYLSGAIMGLSKDEMDEKINHIIQFSELDKFFDRPIKIYSSGMYVRLAFSFAVSVEPDILIIDEALSVGDVYFQQKCLKKINEFKDQGTTILFVSHDLGAIRMLCEQVSLLQKGRLIYTGVPAKGLELYNAIIAEHRNDEAINRQIQQAKSIEINNNSFESGNNKMKIENVNMLDANGQASEAIVSGEELTIEVLAKVYTNQIDNPTCGILIRDRFGCDIFGTNSYQLHAKSFSLNKGDLVLYRFNFLLNLGKGDYTLTVALHAENSHIDDNYHWIDRAKIIQVLPSTDFEFVGVAKLNPTCIIQTQDIKGN